MDENDIYADLDGVDLGNEVENLREENETLSDHIKHLEEDIYKLCEKISQLEKEKHCLATNISELFVTAKAELDRKNRKVTELQTQLDNFLFRRNGKRPLNNATETCSKRFKAYNADYQNRKSSYFNHSSSNLQTVVSVCNDRTESSSEKEPQQMDQRILPSNKNNIKSLGEDKFQPRNINKENHYRWVNEKFNNSGENRNRTYNERMENDYSRGNGRNSNSCQTNRDYYNYHGERYRHGNRRVVDQQRIPCEQSRTVYPNSKYELRENSNYYSQENDADETANNTNNRDIEKKERSVGNVQNTDLAMTKSPNLTNDNSNELHLKGLLNQNADLTDKLENCINTANVEPSQLNNEKSMDKSKEVEIVENKLKKTVNNSKEMCINDEFVIQVNKTFLEIDHNREESLLNGRDLLKSKPIENFGIEQEILCHTDEYDRGKMHAEMNKVNEAIDEVEEVFNDKEEMDDGVLDLSSSTRSENVVILSDISVALELNHYECISSATESSNCNNMQTESEANEVENSLLTEKVCRELQSGYDINRFDQTGNSNGNTKETNTNVPNNEDRKEKTKTTEVVVENKVRLNEAQGKNETRSDELQYLELEEDANNVGYKNSPQANERSSSKAPENQDINSHSESSKLSLFKDKVKAKELKECLQNNLEGQNENTEIERTIRMIIGERNDDENEKHRNNVSSDDEVLKSKIEPKPRSERSDSVSEVKCNLEKPLVRQLSESEKEMALEGNRAADDLAQLYPNSKDHELNESSLEDLRNILESPIKRPIYNNQNDKQDLNQLLKEDEKSQNDLMINKKKDINKVNSSGTLDDNDANEIYNKSSIMKKNSSSPRKRKRREEKKAVVELRRSPRFEANIKEDSSANSSTASGKGDKHDSNPTCMITYLFGDNLSDLDQPFNTGITTDGEIPTLHIPETSGYFNNESQINLFEKNIKESDSNHLENQSTVATSIEKDESRLNLTASNLPFKPMNKKRPRCIISFAD